MRVLVEQPFRCRGTLAELVQLCHSERGGACDLEREGSLVIGRERLNAKRSMIDDRGLEASCTPRGAP